MKESCKINKLISLFLVILALILLDGCMVLKKGISKYSNYPVRIRFNESPDSFVGIPINSRTDFLEFKLPLHDSLIVDYNEGIMIVYPEINGTFFVRGISKKSVVFEGRFFVPPNVVQTFYGGVVDPDSFVVTVEQYFFLVPIRVGEWLYLGVRKFEKNRFRYPNGDIYEPINVTRW